MVATRPDFTVRDLIAALRRGQYAWPGGYPQFFITTDGGALSFAAVREEIWQIARSTRDQLNDGWTIAGVDVNWEDPDLCCDHTNERIESAYAEKD